MFNLTISKLGTIRYDFVKEGSILIIKQIYDKLDTFQKYNLKKKYVNNNI